MTLIRLQSGTARNQSGRFHSRERRASLAGFPELYRTHRFVGAGVMPVATIDTDVVFPSPSLSRPVTFRSVIEITGPNPTGLVFEFGSDTRGCGLALVGAFIGFVAGGLTNESSFALFNAGGDPLVGFRMDFTAAVDPGTGRVRVWRNGEELARDTSVDGDLGGDWSDAGDGSFASIGSGTVHPSIVAGNQAPVGFEVVEPLSVYVGQVPRHFI